MATATEQPATKLLTIEEYLALPDDGRRTELVKGRVVEVPPPSLRHGRICFRFASMLDRAAIGNRLGEVMTNDSRIATRRNPDSLRGGDVVYYGTAKLPPLESEEWDRLFALPPDLVAEVRSPSDTWREMLAKATEYIEAGVVVVILLDPVKRTAWVIREHEEPVRLGPEDELTVPDLLPEFRVRVGAIFE